MRETKKRSKPTPTSAGARAARRAVIAKAVIEQRNPPEVAIQLGVSRQTVYNEMRAPETQQLVREWMKPYHRTVQRMIPRALAAVHTSLKPSQQTRDRLAAVKTLGHVLGWAEGRTNGDSTSSADQRFSGTMEQLLFEYRRISISTSAATAPALPPGNDHGGT